MNGAPIDPGGGWLITGHRTTKRVSRIDGHGWDGPEQGRSKAGTRLEPPAAGPECPAASRALGRMRGSPGGAVGRAAR
jgi:hypothetical protein